MIADKDRRFGIAHDGAGSGLDGQLPRPHHDPIHPPVDLIAPLQRKIICTVKAMKGAGLDRISMTGGTLGIDKTCAEQSAINRRPGIAIEIAAHDHRQCLSSIQRSQLLQVALIACLPCAFAGVV